MCKLELFVITAAVTAMVCTDLMDLVNGGIVYDMETKDNRPVNTVATYTCNTGYTLNGSSTTRTCGSDGVWSGSDPTCEGWRQYFYSHALCVEQY